LNVANFSAGVYVLLLFLPRLIYYYFRFLNTYRRFKNVNAKIVF